MKFGNPALGSRTPNWEALTRLCALLYSFESPSSSSGLKADYYYYYFRVPVIYVVNIKVRWIHDQLLRKCCCSQLKVRPVAEGRSSVLGKILRPSWVVRLTSQLHPEAGTFSGRFDLSTRLPLMIFDSICSCLSSYRLCNVT